MRHLTKFFLVSMFLVLGVVCSKQDESADYVFTGGKVYTENDKQPWAEAVAVKDNKIVCVGDTVGAKKFVARIPKPSTRLDKWSCPALSMRMTI